MKKAWAKVKSFMKDEEGLGTLEMLLILAVLVIIAIAFRDWIMKWLKGLFKQTNDDIDVFQQQRTNIGP